MFNHQTGSECWRNALKRFGPIMHDTRSIFSINRHIDRDIDIAAQSVKQR